MKVTRRAAMHAAGGLSASLLAARWARGDDAGTACSPDRLAQVLADIARARAGVTTLSGPFTQERTIGLLAAKVRSTGTLTLVRPDRLRWELAPPDDVVYWVTPEGLAFRSATGHGKVPAAGSKATAALADLRVLLGGDLGELRARYELTGDCPASGPVAFRAVPRRDVGAASGGASAPFQEIRFTLAPDLVSPASVAIVEGPRDRTSIQFGTLRTNVPVPPASMIPGG